MSLPATPLLLGRSPLPPSSFVTYLDYVVFFQKPDSASKFSPGATRLYLKLLYVANIIADGREWPVPMQFAKSNPEMVGLCGGAPNSLRGYRDELEERGLIATTTGGQGPKAVTVYRLISTKKGAKSEPSEGAKSEPSAPKEGAKSEPSTGQNEAKGSDKGSGMGSNFEPPIIGREEEGEKEEKGAALAATPPASSGKKSTGKRPAKNQLDHAAVAALPLPDGFGPEFVNLWRIFYTSNTHQQLKPTSALELLLNKLGKHPEGLAIELLEAAIGHNWSGFAHPGYTRLVEDWKTRQAHAPAPAPAALPAEELNQEVVNQQQAARTAQRQAKLAQYANR